MATDCVIFGETTETIVMDDMHDDVGPERRRIGGGFNILK